MGDISIIKFIYKYMFFMCLHFE